MKTIAYKFVKWKVDKLERLKDTFPYQLKVKVLEGKKLTREEKDKLYEELRHNTFSRMGISLQGWLFDFSAILNEYFVEFKWGSIFKVYAVDKTSIRECEKEIKRIIRI